MYDRLGSDAMPPNRAPDVAGFNEAFASFASLHTDRSVLGEKLRELVAVAVCASATHLYVHGVRYHIRRARLAGATPEEVASVLQLTSTLGIHAATEGIPILAEVLRERGDPLGHDTDLEQRRLREHFEERRGYWSEIWDDMIALDPELFVAYTDLSDQIWDSDVLTALDRELLCIAFDCAATHLYSPGTRIHMINSLELGATPEMILEVIHLACLLGVHTVEVSMPILAEEFSLPTPA